MSEPVHLRPATLHDTENIWSWRNDSIARAASYNSDLIPYEDHVRWFSSRLEDGRTKFLIAVDRHGTNIGAVRLDLRSNTAEISIALAPEARGQGYGSVV